MGPKSAKSAKYRVFCGYTWKTPGIPGKYPATAWVSCRFPQFCVRFCPRPALRLRETREFPEWSTKHPLFSLEISGNAKCWGPSVFLFVCRKSLCRPSSTVRMEVPNWMGVSWGGCCGAPDRPPAPCPTQLHPWESQKTVLHSRLQALTSHDTQTHHLPPTLYEEPFHPCNICTGVPPTLKRRAPTRVVLWDPQTTNTSTRGCSMCPGGGIPVKQPAGAGHGVGRLGPRSGRNCLSRGAEGPSWGRL